MLRASLERPDRLAAITNESGAWQAWAWDVERDRRRRVSDAPLGVEHADITPDGSHVVWWLDETGDESGRWMASPFDGGSSGPLAPDVPRGWANGLSMVPGAIAIGIVTEEEGFRVFVVRGDEALERYRHPIPAGQSDEFEGWTLGLSADGRTLVTRTAEAGDIEITALRAIDVESGETIAEIGDDGSRLVPVAWSPIPGDGRLLALHEREGWMRPTIWSPRSGERDDIDPGLEGELTPFAWFPDARSILLRCSRDGRDGLIRLDLESRVVATVLEPGTVEDSIVRADGSVWARTHATTTPPRWIDGDGQEVVRLGDSAEPPGHPARAFWVDRGSGPRIQAWLLEPEAEGPHPTIVSIHGGPNWHHTDGYEPQVQAYVDHGYAVLLVNYRGSTGFGRAFREAIRGHLGTHESDDVNAALDHAIEAGWVDADRVVLEGWSWGGYLATLNAGRRPDRWRAVCAGIPVGDYVASHYESAPELRAWDVAMFGDPVEEAERYRNGNPITYVEDVRAPILLIAGEHDSRCPLGQVMTYAVALKALGKSVELHLYPGGHHANATEEQVIHVELTTGFFERAIAAIPAPR